MILSIIVVNYNGEKFLVNLIKSIISNIDYEKYKFEIIIVDNDSKDNSIPNTKKFINQNKLNHIIKLVELEDNLGFGKANNIGVTESNGEFLLFINNDTKILKFDLPDLISKYNSIKPGIIGLFLKNKDLTSQKSVFKFPSKFKLLLECLNIKNIAKKIYNFIRSGFSINNNKFRQVDYVSGACFFTQADVFKKLKGFDEDYYFYHEECDLMYRAYQRKIYCYFDEENQVIHYGGGAQPLNKMKLINFYKSKIIFYKKHFNLKFLSKFCFIKNLFLRKLLYNLNFNITINPVNIYKSKNSISKNEINKIYSETIRELRNF